MADKSFYKNNKISLLIIRLAYIEYIYIYIPID